MGAFAVINCVPCHPLGSCKKQYLALSMTIEAKSNSQLEMRSCYLCCHPDQKIFVVVTGQNVVQMMFG